MAARIRAIPQKTTNAPKPIRRRPCNTYPTSHFVLRSGAVNGVHRIWHPLNSCRSPRVSNAGREVEPLERNHCRPSTDGDCQLAVILNEVAEDVPGSPKLSE